MVDWMVVPASAMIDEIERSADCLIEDIVFVDVTFATADEVRAILRGDDGRDVLLEP